MRIRTHAKTGRQPFTLWSRERFANNAANEIVVADCFRIGELCHVDMNGSA